MQANKIESIMNDDRYLRSNKELEKVGCKCLPKEVKDEAKTVCIHPISRWLLRTVLDNLFAENDEKLAVQIGESMEFMNKEEYGQLQQDLIALGETKNEVCRGMFDEDPASDNTCRCFKA